MMTARVEKMSKKHLKNGPRRKCWTNHTSKKLETRAIFPKNYPFFSPSDRKILARIRKNGKMGNMMINF